jgi:phenylalanyl-tRNA synthetase alpha chain
MKGVSEHLLASLHPLELKVLPQLKEGMTLSALCTAAGMQEVEAMRALQWLENKKALTMEQDTKVQLYLDTNGTKALAHGMPEMRFLKAVQEGAATSADIATHAKLDPQEIGASIGLLRKAHLIDVAKDNSIALTAEGKKYDPAKNDAMLFLQKIQKAPLNVEKLNEKEREQFSILKNRKEYLIQKERKDRIIHLTEIGKELVKVDFSKHDFAERLTSEDLKTGAWKEKKYRAYDVSINVPKIPMGKEHFVQDAIDYVRQIWVEMGFQEMEGDMTQSAFWDLDALFVPQDHPARELQDTFYLETPARTTIARNIFERVKEVHETGSNTGSKGWRYSFNKEESEKLLMRTHTTVLSAQTLWKIKEGKLPMPGKYFAIGKCFRNEAVDWKHAFEFNQVEGIVVDPNVTFAQLLGYLKIFFAKMGYPNIRLMPNHFPYTEPSVQIDVWHEQRKEWVEFGGAGMFRPEVTKILLGEEVPVLAWGPGFDRIIMEYFKITDIRDLYRNDIKQMRDMKRFLK